MFVGDDKLKRCGSMKTIDRVMKAYSEKYQLTDAQAALVRKKLSIFIVELQLGRAAGPTQMGTLFRRSIRIRLLRS
jgi:hypothetical protein